MFSALDISVFFFELGAQSVFAALIVGVTVGRLVNISAAVITDVVAERIGEKGRVNDGQIVFGDFGRIITESGVIVFFERVIHGVDGGLAVVVAIHGVDIGFLDEENYHEQGGKSADDHEFDKSETFFSVHSYIITHLVKGWFG